MVYPFGNVPPSPGFVFVLCVFLMYDSGDSFSSVSILVFGIFVMDGMYEEFMSDALVDRCFGKSFLGTFPWRPFGGIECDFVLLGR